MARLALHTFCGRVAFGAAGWTREACAISEKVACCFTRETLSVAGAVHAAIFAFLALAMSIEVIAEEALLAALELMGLVLVGFNNLALGAARVLAHSAYVFGESIAERTSAADVFCVAVGALEDGTSDDSLGFWREFVLWLQFKAILIKDAFAFATVRWARAASCRVVADAKVENG